MYQTLKKVTRNVLPQKLLLRWEFALREVVYQLRYKGTNHKCNLCNASLTTFIEPQEKQLCPRCGSLPRTRFLRYLLEKELRHNQLSLLHFSPQRYLMKWLKKQPQIHYYPSDYLSSHTPYHFDLQHIELNSNSIDLVVCYHVFEHIPYDRKGMKELFRVLKPGGSAFLQVPFRKGPTIEDIHETNPKVREEKFGQDDHLRWYNQDDFCKRLTEAGFAVSKLKVAEQNLPFEKWGLAKKEVVIMAKKPS